MVRAVTSIVVVCAAIGVSFGAANAFAAAPAAYPPAVCATLSANTTTPHPGGTITLVGAHFTPGASVRLELQSSTSIVLGTATADANGSFTTTVGVPTGLTGQHSIVAVTGVPRGSGCSPSISFGLGGTSTSDGEPHTGGAAFTGVDVAGTVGVAAVLLIVGVALARAGARRRKDAANV